MTAKKPAHRKKKAPSAKPAAKAKKALSSAKAGKSRPASKAKTARAVSKPTKRTEAPAKKPAKKLAKKVTKKVTKISANQPAQKTAKKPVKNGGKVAKSPTAKSPAKSPTKISANGSTKTSTKPKIPEPSPSIRAAIASDGGRVVLPRWFKQPLQALVASHLSADATENGPHGLAFTLSQAFGDLVNEQLGASAESAMWKVLGSPYDEASPLVKRLAKAFERAFEPHEEGGLRDDIDEAWLVKTFLTALGIGFSARKVVTLRVLTRPLFEKGVAGVLASVRGSSTPPRTVAQRIIEAISAVAKKCGYGEADARLAELRKRDPKLEAVLAPRLDGLRLSSAPPAQWRELGFPEVAAKVRDDRDTVAVPSPVWVARERDAGTVLDRLADIADLVWTADEPGAVSPDDEARLAEAGLVQPYRIDAMFEKGDTLKHPVFGLGVVISATRETIEVAFPGGAKKLAHGRVLS